MSDHGCTRKNVIGISAEDAKGEVPWIQIWVKNLSKSKLEDILLSNPPASGVDSADPTFGDHSTCGPLLQDCFGYHFWYSNTSVQPCDMSHLNPKLTTTNDQHRWWINIHWPWQTSSTATTGEMTELYEHLLDAITTILSRIQTNNSRFLQTQVLTFRGTKGSFDETEHLLRKPLRPLSKTLSEERKLQYFQSLLREEEIEFYQSLTITKEKTLNEVLTKFCKEVTKEDLMESHALNGSKQKTISRQKPSQTSLGDWNFSPKKHFKKRRTIHLDLSRRKLPITIQEDSVSWNKEEACLEESKTFRDRRQLYNHFNQQQCINTSIWQRRWKTMENRRRHHNGKMPDRRIDFKGSDSNLRSP